MSFEAEASESIDKVIATSMVGKTNALDVEASSSIVYVIGESTAGKTNALEVEASESIDYVTAKSLADRTSLLKSFFMAIFTSCVWCQPNRILGVSQQIQHY